jgi:hypothetical protein
MITVKQPKYALDCAKVTIGMGVKEVCHAKVR